MVDSTVRLQQLLGNLAECRAELTDLGEACAAKLLSMAELELRLRINRMGDLELRAISEKQPTTGVRAPLDFIRLPSARRN